MRIRNLGIILLLFGLVWCLLSYFRLNGSDMFSSNQVDNMIAFKLGTVNGIGIAMSILGLSLTIFHKKIS